MQSTVLKPCPKCQLLVCHKNKKTDLSEGNTGNEGFEKDISVCEMLHVEECDLILHLKDSIFKFMEENANLDSKESGNRDLER